MKTRQPERRPPFRILAPAALVSLCLSLAAGAPPALANGGGARKVKVFEVCLHGCRFNTIQNAVNGAGSFQFKKKNAKVKAVVAVRPGKYVEGVVLDGTLKKKNFNGLTIEGTTKNRRKTILEGKNAKGELGPAQSGIEAIGVDGLVLKNMWARNFQSNGFFIHAYLAEGQRCDDYAMENLLATANRSYGLFAKSCKGGRMVDSAASGNGDSAFYIGETPCDSPNWTNHGEAPAPCQRKPKWTLLKNDKGYESLIGYSGTNSKYVKIVDSAFYDNGLGMLPNTQDAEGYEPSGWEAIEHDQVFWNNFNYFLPASPVHGTSPPLGQIAGSVIHFPIGAGIVLYGDDHDVVRQNQVFGNYKWGIASFSGPSEIFVANVGDDAKNINNQITENTMGRDGADPNGEFDFWNDDTGGGNCWSANSTNSTFAPGNGKVSLSAIYPSCPQPQVLNDQVKSLNLTPGLQVTLGSESDPRTLLGYTSANPPQDQQCSWVRRLESHPPFKSYKPIEVLAGPGDLSCG